MFISTKIIHPKAPSQFLIGLGTGRCGTKSLAYLLNEQENSFVFHEIAKDDITWDVTNNSILHLRKNINYLLSKKKFFVGSTASHFLPYVDIIKKMRPECKFIVMKRDRKSTIKSWVDWTMLDLDDFWVDVESKDKDWQWHKCFPSYSKKYSKEERIGLYWDEYNREIEKLIKKYPNSFWTMNMECLNDKEAIENMLDFCGFLKKKIVIFKENGLETRKR